MLHAMSKLFPQSMRAVLAVFSLCLAVAAHTEEPATDTPCLALLEDKYKNRTPDRTVILACAQHGESEDMIGAVSVWARDRDAGIVEQIVSEIDPADWNTPLESTLIMAGRHDLLVTQLRQQGLSAMHVRLERKVQWLGATLFASENGRDAMHWLLAEADIPFEVLSLTLPDMVSKPDLFFVVVERYPSVLSDPIVRQKVFVRSIELGEHEIIDVLLRNGMSANEFVDQEYPVILHALIDGRREGMKNRETWDFLVSRGADPVGTVCNLDKSEIEPWREQLPDWAAAVITETLEQC